MKDRTGIILRLLILLVVAIAVLLQVFFVMLDCRLVWVTSTEVDHGNRNNNNNNNNNRDNQRTTTTTTTTRQSFGLFQEPTTSHGDVSESFSAFGDCVPYDWMSEGGGYVRMAQLSNLFAIIGGGIGFLTVSMETFCMKMSCARVSDVISLGTAILFSGLVFLVNKSDVCQEADACSMGRGGAANVAAMVLYIMAALIMCCTPKPRPVCKQLCGNSDDDDDDFGKDIDDTAASGSDRMGSSGRERQRRFRKTPSSIMRALDDEETLDLDDVLTVQTMQQSTRRLNPRVQANPTRRRQEQYPSVKKYPRSHLKRTPSAVMRAMEEETVSISDMMTLETRPPVDIIDMEENGTFVDDGLTVDPALLERQRSLRRTPSAVMRALEEDSFDSNDPMFVVSPDMSMHKSLSLDDVAELETETDPTRDSTTAGTSSDSTGSKQPVSPDDQTLTMDDFYVDPDQVYAREVAWSSAHEDDDDDEFDKYDVVRAVNSNIIADDDDDCVETTLVQSLEADADVINADFAVDEREQRAFVQSLKADADVINADIAADKREQKRLVQSLKADARVIQVDKAMDAAGKATTTRQSHSSYTRPPKNDKTFRTSTDGSVLSVFTTASFPDDVADFTPKSSLRPGSSGSSWSDNGRASW